MVILLIDIDHQWYVNGRVESARVFPLCFSIYFFVFGQFRYSERSKENRGYDMLRYLYFIFALSLYLVLYPWLGSASLVAMTRSMLAELVRQTSELEERRQAVEATRSMNVCHCMPYAFWILLNWPQYALICLINLGHEQDIKPWKELPHIDMMPYEWCRVKVEMPSTIQCRIQCLAKIPELLA